jgi:methyl halide transferase
LFSREFNFTPYPMDKDLLKEQIHTAFENFKTAIRQHTDINKKRADGGWTVGEIGNHIIKSTGSDFGRTKKTERPYNQHAAAIRDLFLDFTAKLSAARVLEPDEKKYSLMELFTSLDYNKEMLFKMIDKDDLTEICIDIELPVWGSLTKYEWLLLIENHTIRHTRQVVDFDPVTDQGKSVQGKTMSKEYWDNLYSTNETSWDIGFPAPAIKDYIDQWQNKKAPILIPGCGNAYEAQYLLTQGFTNVTLIDIAPALTSALQDKFRFEIGKRIRVITGDFFDHEGKYQLIIEQTFLSAIDPSVRPKYVDKMHSLLFKGGHLTGVIFNKIFEGNGPPFGGTAEEYKNMFSPKFEIKQLEPCYNSIDRRKGSEAFINLVAK